MNKKFHVIDGPDGSGKGTQIALAKSWMEGLGLKVRVSEEPNGTIDQGRIREMLLYTRKERIGSDFSMWEGTWLAGHFGMLARRIAESDSPDQGYLLDEMSELTFCKRFNPRIEIALFVVGRLLHLQEVILPFLRGQTNDDVLLIDRFHPSTFAYQIFALSGSLNESDSRFVNSLYAWHMRHLLGDLNVFPSMIIVDVPVETSVARLRSRPGRATYYDEEKKDFLGGVRRGYLSFADHWGDIADYALEEPVDLVRIVDGSGTREETFSQIRAILDEDVAGLVIQAH